MISVAKLDDVIKIWVNARAMSLSVRRTAVSTAADAGYLCTRVRNMTLLMAGAHDDQEGFFVLEGRGRAMVGDDEIVLEPGVCFVVPAGVKHCMKCEQDSGFCKVFWFHAAV